MNRQEDFLNTYSRLDFDASGAAQERVWQRIHAPAVKRPLWRTAVAWGVCALFFAAGMGASAVFSARAVRAPYGGNFSSSGQTPGQEAVWVCVLDRENSHPSGCHCWKHRAAGGVPAQEMVFPLESGSLSHCRQTPPHAQKCEGGTYPSAPSFYDFCEEC